MTADMRAAKTALQRAVERVAWTVEQMADQMAYAMADCSVGKRAGSLVAPTDVSSVDLLAANWAVEKAGRWVAYSAVVKAAKLGDRTVECSVAWTADC